jgi:toxin ParE1/3/4
MRSDKAAEAFLAELDYVIAKVSQHPEHYQLWDSGTRKAAMRRFPFLIVFRERADGIEIIALMHGRRRPGYWRDRA